MFAHSARWLTVNGPALNPVVARLSVAASIDVAVAANQLLNLLRRQVVELLSFCLHDRSHGRDEFRVRRSTLSYLVEVLAPHGVAEQGRRRKVGTAQGIGS